MKPDPRLAALDTYPYRLEIQPRFGDLDINAHLNNVSIMRHFEEARVRMQRDFFGPTMTAPTQPGTLRVVVAQMLTDFIGEGGYPESLQAGIGMTQVGNTSYRMASALFQSGRCIAIQQSVLVLLDDDGPVRVPDEIRARMQACWLALD